MMTKTTPPVQSSKKNRRLTTMRPFVPKAAPPMSEYVRNDWSYSKHQPSNFAVWLVSKHKPNTKISPKTQPHKRKAYGRARRLAPRTSEIEFRVVCRSELFSLLSN
eukprot:Lithocolla_globosa_v1_NODE_3481_length_1659_cov_6.390274.p2 type:complete len:106 gc:universal NODE_3481_length_1659_cov_6.390274:599-282(-)